MMTGPKRERPSVAKKKDAKESRYVGQNVEAHGYATWGKGLMGLSDVGQNSC